MNRIFMYVYMYVYIHRCIYTYIYTYVYIHIYNKQNNLISGCLCVCEGKYKKVTLMWSNPFRASVMLMSVQNLTTQFKIVIYKKKKKEIQKNKTLRVEMVKPV